MKIPRKNAGAEEPTDWLGGCCRRRCCHLSSTKCQYVRVMHGFSQRTLGGGAEHPASGLMSSPPPPPPPALRYQPSTGGRDQGMNHSGAGQRVCLCVCVRNATAEFPMTALLTRSSLHELPESRPSALSHPLITYSWSWAVLQMSALLLCDFCAHTYIMLLRRTGQDRMCAPDCRSAGFSSSEI